MSRQLDDPILDRGIRNAHFFNGRLLTAEDLKTEQIAGRQQHQQLGVAIGEGVVEGLEVVLESPGSPTTLPIVAVMKGLALNRKGQALSLPDDERIALVRRLDAIPPDAGIFADCEAPTHTFTNLQNGVYVLVIAPASGYQEHVPVRGHRPSDTVAGCGRRYAVEGVQFRLVRVNLNNLSDLGANMPAFDPATLTQLNGLIPLTDNLSRSKLRNLLAHLGFGTDQLAGIASAPFRQLTESSLKEKTFYGAYGLADVLRAAGAMTDCDVPLALIFWTGGLIRFVDVWSVRRRVYARAESKLSHLFPARRIAEAEAMFFQFEEHLLSLIGTQPNPEKLIATSALRWLPPAGLVPIRSAAHPVGVTHENFFLNKSFGPPTPLSGAKLRALFTESLNYPPIDLSKPEFVHLYTVTENSQAQTSANPPQPFVVFASREMPYYSEQPRFANLCQTLRETRSSYRDLNQKNVFLGNESKPEGLTARLAVMAAILAVMNAAGERFVSACRCGCMTTYQKGLALLNDLYEVQKGLVTVLNTNWDGVTDSNTKNFASLLNDYLDVATPGFPTNNLSLKAAITAQNFVAALGAQNAINGLVLSWTGEATTGTLQVNYQSSTKGLTLVRDDRTPFNYTFRVTNRTNRPLDVGLQAAFDSPRMDWNQGISLRAVTGEIIDSVALQPFNANNPNDPTAFRDIIVAIISPENATDEQQGTLRLTARVPPPVGVADDGTVNLAIGPRATPEPTTTVSFIGPTKIDGNPTKAPVGEDLTYTFNSRFHTTQGVWRDFRFLVLITSSATVANLYSITFGNKTAETDTGINTPTQKVTRPFPMTNDVEDSVILIIRPRAGAAGAQNALTFAVRIQAVTDDALQADSANFTVIATS